MRNKLQKFVDFTNTLLPHETNYLLHYQQFVDEERLAILQRIHYNCEHIEQFTAYDEAIDKRKYSHLKNWIVERLNAVDVDMQYEWISEMDKKIMSDAISPDEEQDLLKFIKRYQHPIFFFTRFYQLIQNYRQFLLVRMRYADFQITDNFLKQYEPNYVDARAIYDKLYLATQDIVNQYKAGDSESMQWEHWLTENFYNEELDGLNRYQALIRLNFIAFNYRKFDTLFEKFDYLDKKFCEGKYYSKRLLLNYYGNRLLLHSKYKDLDKAAYYGFLSIRSKNHDYLYYLTNLCAILLRQKKPKVALDIMQRGAKEAKNTKNMHAKVGYISFYMECLNACQQYKAAERLAVTYLNAYRKEIKEYRWHLFFSAYLKSLILQHKYQDILQVVRQHRLLKKEQAYQKNANYLPTILWFNAVAELQEGRIEESAFKTTIENYTEKVEQKYLLDDLLKLIKQHS